MCPGEQFAASANARTIEIAAGSDFEAECLMVVEPGDVCSLAAGDYPYDGITRVHGTASAPITITGDPEACIKGTNTQDRVLQIAHDYYVVDGICFDGDHDGDYVATAIYVLGADEKHGITVGGVEVTSSVTGLKLTNLEIKNFGSECVHFRYFVTWAEVEGCTIQNCGYDAFHGGGGGKVGEGIYVGTALDQVDDGKVSKGLVCRFLGMCFSRPVLVQGYRHVRSLCCQWLSTTVDCDLSGDPYTKERGSCNQVLSNPRTTVGNDLCGKLKRRVMRMEQLERRMLPSAADVKTVELRNLQIMVVKTNVD